MSRLVLLLEYSFPARIIVLALPNEVVGEIVGNKNEALSNHGQDLITGQCYKQ